MKTKHMVEINEVIIDVRTQNESRGIFQQPRVELADWFNSYVIAWLVCKEFNRAAFWSFSPQDKRSVRKSYSIEYKKEIVEEWQGKNLWTKITDSCVATALRAGYLDKNFAFHETSIARHERLGPKILREIELPESENSGAILETDDLQDIPEDDDMIVFE